MHGVAHGLRNIPTKICRISAGLLHSHYSALCLVLALLSLEEQIVNAGYRMEPLPAAKAVTLGESAAATIDARGRASPTEKMPGACSVPHLCSCE